ncbi:MAG: cysteine desulfurase [Clostridium sp.]|nr:cysteine desulfurase [Clostridium sp.]
MEIYLDNAATTKISKNVIKKISYQLENTYGNSSSIHSLGRDAETKLNDSRDILKSVINGKDGKIVFNSGATEGNNQVIKNYIKEGAHFITTDVEHASVLASMKYAESKGVKVTYLSVDNNGDLNLKELNDSITKDTSLISIMMVNNEQGTINPIKKISEIIKENSNRAKLHVDAVQGFLKIPVDVKDMGIDYLTASSHKVHGPKGVGFLYINENLILDPLIHGTNHEFKMRAGTVNVPSIVGFSEAIKENSTNIEENYEKVLKLKNRLIKNLEQVKGFKLNSTSKESSPYIVNISFEHIQSEVMLNYLSEKGIYISIGSACTSKDSKDSHVLQAMNIPKEYLKGSMRISFSDTSTINEIDIASDKIIEGIKFFGR